MITKIIELDQSALKTVALIWRALNHKLRRELVEFIEIKERINVTEIYVNLRIEQSVASQHLAILREAGVVKIEREGKFIFYSIDYEKLDKINQFTKELVG